MILADRKQTRKKRSRRSFAALTIVVILFVVVWPARPTQAVTREIIFPVIGTVSYSDDFGAPRVGHTHEGNDLLGKKMMPLVAAADGTIRFVTWPERDYGYLVSIEDAEGYQYWYLHINNDHPGTDDSLGGGKFAYAPGMQSDNPVVKGQLIGWMGDSGNAESTTPHLHFEIHDPSGTPFDPYDSLKDATHITKPVIPPALPNELLPFGEFRGGASIAYGEIDGDPTSEELITGAGPGGGPQVRVFNADNTVIDGFFAYDQTFHGGIDVTTGDINGDGVDEIITAAGPGGQPDVRIFNLKGERQGNFFAYDPNYIGGVRIAAADLDGDGKAEIITAPGKKMEPRIKVFNVAGEVVTEFLVYVPQFQGGVDVAAIAATASNQAMIVTGAGPGGGPDVRYFSPAGELLNSFYAYDKAFRGGVHVDIADVRKHGAENSATTPPEIVTVPASRGGSQVRVFDLAGQPEYQKFVFEPWWSGGYDVAGTDGVIRVASGQTNKGPGGRRASVMNIVISSFSYYGFL